MTDSPGDLLARQVREWAGSLPAGSVTAEEKEGIDGEPVLTISPTRSGAAKLIVDIMHDGEFSLSAGDYWFMDGFVGFERFSDIAEGVRRGQLQDRIQLLAGRILGITAVLTTPAGDRLTYYSGFGGLLRWLKSETTNYAPWD